ncbi:alginate lyase family protein [Salinarimonas sp. NSM]|uniref:alginate lyase family protein n=1 Tax=Salinarimonas sp. NSM TaxID=3458003 RepID=UPI00403722DF
MLDAARRHWPTAVRLGLPQVATVVAYRLAVRTGLVARAMPVQPAPGAPLFRLAGDPRPAPEGLRGADAILAEADALAEGRIRLFSDALHEVGDPPRWQVDPVTGSALGDETRHWSHIHEFGASGDIKAAWEASRFDWALVLAQAWRITGDRRHADLLRRWCEDWRTHNPACGGVNWKCGQETSYRLFQVLLAARLLGEDERPEPGLVSFVAEHCRRIRPTIRYAIAQDNNHGTSEAAALYIGGAWLGRHVDAGSAVGRAARRWRDAGAAWLGDRARRLVAEDGSFSEHSVTYHRIVLETFTIAELWRRWLDAPALPPVVGERTRLMIAWLDAMVDADGGGAPLIGGNDGTDLFKLAGPRYGDFRFCLQLAARVFENRDLFGPGPWEDAARWLDLPAAARPAEARPAGTARLFAAGGWAVLALPSAPSVRAVVRLPVYRFRPAQADALHLDLWVAGVNVLPDAGTYSYNAPEETYDYFVGTRSHNTIEVDGRSQMPRIGRFLFGDWLVEDPKARLDADDEGCMLASGYRDGEGVRHRRTVRMAPGRIDVSDEITGARSGAVLRWRLAPELEWSQTASGVRSTLLDIAVTAPDGAVRAVVGGALSTRYLRTERLPVYEVAARGSGSFSFTTVMTLAGAFPEATG